MLTIRALNKTYGSRIQALRNVDLDIHSGMFGLLGPNGAGKTTLMKILASLLEPDSGTAEMNGVHLITRKDKARRMLGYLPQEFGVYSTLTAERSCFRFYLCVFSVLWPPCLIDGGWHPTQNHMDHKARTELKIRNPKFEIRNFAASLLAQFKVTD